MTQQRIRQKPAVRRKARARGDAVETAPDTPLNNFQAPTTESTILQMQRLYGNQTTQRLLRSGTIQPPARRIHPMRPMLQRETAEINGFLEEEAEPEMQRTIQRTPDDDCIDCDSENTPAQRLVQRTPDDCIDCDTETALDTAPAQRLVQRQPATTAPKDEKTILQEILDELLPVGRGYHLEGDLGITPVIPIYISEGRLIEIKRLDDQNLHILFRQQGIAAGDTGVGAGAFLGNKKRGQGIGATAGANAQAGFKFVTHQEFVLPIAKIKDFFLDIATERAKQVFTPTPPGAMDMTAMKALRLGLSSLGGNLLDSYEVRRRVEFGAFAQADAEASVGIREKGTNREGKGKSLFGGDNYVDGSKLERGGERSAPSKTADNEWSVMGIIQSLSTLRAAIQARVDANVSVDTKKGKENPDGTKETEINFAAEANGGASLQLPIFTTLPMPTAVGGGVNVKVTLKTDAQENVIDKKVDVELFVKTGDLDIFAGPASQSNFKLNALQIQTVEQLVELLTPGGNPVSIGSLAKAMLEKVEVRQRYNLQVDMGRKFAGFMRSRAGARTIITDTTNWKKATKGASIGAYLTVTYNMDYPDILKVWELIKPQVSAGAQAATDADGIMGTYEALKKFVTDFADSPEFEKVQNMFLDTVGVTEASLRFTADAGVGAQVAIAKGAKVRLNGFVEAGLFCEHNLASSRITLRNFLDVAADALADPKKHIPDCPLLHWMYDNLAGKNEPGAAGDGEKTAGAGNEDGNGTGGDGKKIGSKGGAAVVEVVASPVATPLSGKNEMLLTGEVRYMEGQIFHVRIAYTRDGVTYLSWVAFKRSADTGDAIELVPNADLPVRVTPEELQPGMYIPHDGPPISVSKSVIRNIKDYQK